MLIKNVTQITSSTSFDIDHNGNLTTDGDVTQDGNTLSIDGGSSGTTITTSGNFNIGSFGSMFSGGSTMTMNGIRVQSNNNSISLVGPNSTVLIVNGVRTTFGKIATGSDSTPEPEKPRQEYSFADGCKISSVQLVGSGKSNISADYMADNLNVSIRGSARFGLSASKRFSSLAISISGSGSVSGKARTVYLSVSVSGSGSVSGIKVISNGSLTMSGSGHISVLATTPKNVQKSNSGSGSISVGRLTADDESSD